MKISLIPFLMCTGLVLYSEPLHSQTFSQNTSTAFPILTFGVGARAEGMGESFTAISDDLSALHYNSAGLAQIQQPELAFTHNLFLSDGFYDNLAVLFPVGPTETLAFSINYLNYGSIDQRDNFGNLIGTYTPFDISAEAGFGFLLDKDLSLGVSSQWIRQNISGVVNSGLLWDIGLLVKPFEDFSIGLSIKNLGVETGGYDLPTDFLWGAAYRFDLAQKDFHSLLISTGGDFAFQGDSHLNSGLEYSIQKIYFLRVGYSFDLQDNELDGTQGLDFGAGVKVGDFQVDYSFSFEGDLGNIQRFGLSVFFENQRKSTKAESNNPHGTYLTPSVSNLLIPPSGTTNHPVMLKFQVTSPDDLSPEQLCNQAEEKLVMGLKQEALDLYLKAVEKDPRYEKAWMQLGKLYFDKSLESYGKVLELDPNNDRLRQWLQQFQP